jgi:hypothetical protein
VYVVVVHCVMLSRVGGCCELKKARGGGKMRGGGYMKNPSWYRGGTCRR